MKRKTMLYIGLLALGIVLIGSGVWLMLGSTQAKVVIPESNPVIYEQVRYLMKGENYELYIYTNGSILYIEEKGLRLPSPERPATRTWSTGNFTVEQVNNLLAYFENSGLDKLEDYYNFPGEKEASGTIRRSDLDYTITIVSRNFSKSVTASGYLTPDNGEKYPDLPSPLNAIYGRLRTLTMTTEKVYQEDISR